jgi:hypothetical protein
VPLSAQTFNLSRQLLQAGSGSHASPRRKTASI